MTVFGHELLLYFMAVCGLAVVSLNDSETSSQQCQISLTSVRMEVTPMVLQAMCRDNSSTNLVIRCGQQMWIERIVGFCSSYDLNIGEAFMDQPLPSSSVFMQLVQSGRVLDSVKVEVLAPELLLHYRISVWGNHNTRFILEVTRECTRSLNNDSSNSNSDTQQTYIVQNLNPKNVHTTDKLPGNVLKNNKKHIMSHVPDSSDLVSRWWIKDKRVLYEKSFYPETAGSDSKNPHFDQNGYEVYKNSAPTISKTPEERPRNAYAYTRSRELSKLQYLPQRDGDLSVDPTTNARTSPRSVHEEYMSPENISLQTGIEGDISGSSSKMFVAQVAHTTNKHQQFPNQQIDKLHGLFRKNLQNKSGNLWKPSVQSSLIMNELNIEPNILTEDTYLDDPAETRKRRAENNDNIIDNDINIELINTNSPSNKHDLMVSDSTTSIVLQASTDFQTSFYSTPQYLTTYSDDLSTGYTVEAGFTNAFTLSSYVSDSSTPQGLYYVPESSHIDITPSIISLATSYISEAITTTLASETSLSLIVNAGESSSEIQTYETKMTAIAPISSELIIQSIYSDTLLSTNQWSYTQIIDSLSSSYVYVSTSVEQIKPDTLLTVYRQSQETFSSTVNNVVTSTSLDVSLPNKVVDSRILTTIDVAVLSDVSASFSLPSHTMSSYISQQSSMSLSPQTFLEITTDEMTSQQQQIVSTTHDSSQWMSSNYLFTTDEMTSQQQQIVSTTHDSSLVLPSPLIILSNKNGDTVGQKSHSTISLSSRKLYQTSDLGVTLSDALQVPIRSTQAHIISSDMSIYAEPSIQFSALTTNNLQPSQLSDSPTSSQVPWSTGTTQASNNDQRGLEDDSFWPAVAALVIGVPAVIVLGIAITVIYRKRRQDPSKFFNMKTLNSSSLSSIATPRRENPQQSSVDV